MTTFKCVVLTKWTNLKMFEEELRKALEKGIGISWYPYST